MATKEKILLDMLDIIPEKYDKRPGGFIYDALAPVAEQFERVDQNIEGVKDKLNIENLSGAELTQRVKERSGIERNPATRAIGSVTVTGAGTINEGDLFETESGIQFRATETKIINESGDVAIEAIEPGSAGMVAADTITLFPVTLSGFTAVTNINPTYDGFDAESDIDLLQRYYDHIRTPATSGNKAHYKVWAREVSGVGPVRVFPLWDGHNTVKVLIIDANRQPASPELVAEVQEHIDPDIQGLGEGAAPVGAFVTVASANGLEIDVEIDIVLSSGYDEETVKANIEESITEYLFGIAFEEAIISYARTGTAILTSEGVEDYSNLEINGGTSNIAIDEEEVAILGTVSINVI
jgi:uncharacterized phage protein gp47/JayE